MANEGVVRLKEALAGLPTVDTIGLTRAREGPPLPAKLNIRWPEFVRRFTAEHWPGVPIPRKWGEKVMPHLPLGLGEVVLKVIDTFGL